MGIEELLKLQIEQTNEHIRSFASIYWQWYAFYWTLNGGVLAWLYVKRKDDSIAKEHLSARRAVARLFMFLTFQGVVASAGMAIELYRMSQDTATMARAFATLCSGSTTSQAAAAMITHTYPKWFGMSAVVAAAISLTGLFITWWYVEFGATKNKAPAHR